MQMRGGYELVIVSSPIFNTVIEVSLPFWPLDLQNKII